MNLDPAQTQLLIILAYLVRDAFFFCGLLWVIIHLVRAGHVTPVPVPAPGPVPLPVPKPGPILVPPAPVPTPAPGPAPGKPDNSGESIRLTLKWEGGNDDDPRDPGGRTSRGILQREWNVWRNTHPGLPSDVWQAPQSQVVAIYKQNYWDVLHCDALPLGVDYAVYDYGVNSGVSRAAKVLQAILGVPADGVMGAETLVQVSFDKKPTLALINQICDERLHFLQGLHTWSTFGRGWGDRVAGVRKQATAMVP